MSVDAIYQAWAPDDAAWSTWVKPASFAFTGSIAAADKAEDSTADSGTRLDLSVASRLPPPDGKTAIVIDLPGEESVWFGLALAEAGYRPIPLYNAVPGPTRAQALQQWI